MYRQNLMESTTRNEVLSKFRNYMDECDPPLSPLEEEMYVSNMTPLPYEILMKIFEQLPLDTRKNVKLSCKYFKDICDRISRIKREKLVFRENASFTGMISVLQLSKSMSIDLVLYGHNFELLPINVWINFGPKIRSIELYFCDFSTVCLHRVMKYCVDLESMVICDDRRMDRRLKDLENEPDIIEQFRKIDFYENGTTARSFIEGLDYYLLYGVSHKQLKTFTLRSDKPLIKESFTLEKIFEIFPGIKRFNFDGEYTVER